MKSFLHSLFATAGLALPAFAVQIPFDVPTASSDDVKTVYGVDIFKNSMSTVNLSVDTGSVLQAQIVYKSDTAPVLNSAGDLVLRSHSANVGILVPLNAAWGIRRLPTFDSLTFEMSLDDVLAGIAISFGSPAYVDSLSNLGLVYESALTTGPADRHKFATKAHGWQTESFTRTSFQLPTWIRDAKSADPTRWLPHVAATPSFDSVLAAVKNIQIAPKCKFNGSTAGWNFSTNQPCNTCVTAFQIKSPMTVRFRNINLYQNGSDVPMKLGVGNGLEIGVRNPAKGTSYLGLSWNRGQLRLEDASQWSRMQILSLDGKAIASLKPASSQSLELANGTYFANLTDLQGRTLSQSFQVLH